MQLHEEVLIMTSEDSSSILQRSTVLDLVYSTAPPHPCVSTACGHPAGRDRLQTPAVCPREVQHLCRTAGTHTAKGEMLGIDGQA